jgi:hypothetical protein
MNIPPHWSKARFPHPQEGDKHSSVIACGWSFVSAKDAAQNAATRAKKIFDLLSSGQQPSSYEYSDRPVREEIVQELTDGDTPIALVTRNRYGALVLNSAQVLFADVDFPPTRPSGWLETIGEVFNPRRKDARRREAVSSTLGRITSWASQNPSRSFRLYRTRAGLRLLFTDQLYDPAAPATIELLHQLGSDPMYCTLTEKQGCFRARLTAKPWRCGCDRPPNSFPWEDAAAKATYRRWEAQYDAAQSTYRTCDLIREFGQAAPLPSLAHIIQFHDTHTGISSTAPLA